MTQALGPDWQSLFELTAVGCSKPLFFTNKQTPFYQIDKTAASWKGE